MADTIRSQDYFLNSSTGAFKDNTTGLITAQALRDLVKSVQETQINLFTGRLTLETGVYVSTADQSAKSILYLTGPQGGNVQTWLYDGTSWKFYSFAQISLTLSALTSDKPYDVWLYDNSGTPALELLAWTNDTTRATALATQDGVIVKSGATTRRYVGTIYTSGTSTTEDTEAKRYVWNYYNRISRSLYNAESTASWTLGASSNWSQRGSKQVEFVCGNATALDVALSVWLAAIATSGGTMVAIGYDSTTTAYKVAIAQQNTTEGIPLVVNLKDVATPGRHVVSWLECSAVNTSTFNGTAASPNRVSGLTGSILC